MQRARVGLALLLLLTSIFMTTAFAEAVPPLVIALVDGRTYDQAHDIGFMDWGGPVQYVYMTHRDGSSLPPEEGGVFCGSGCAEWVTHLGNGGTVSGSFDRNVSYFGVMVAFSHDASVGRATLQACSATSTWDLYNGPGAGMPGFINMELAVPAGCKSWSLSASSGYVDFRSADVIYSAPPPTSTNTWTPLPSFTPSATSTTTLTPTSTNTPTPTFTPTSTATNTPSSTPTPLPPEIIGQVVCDLWGDAGWCRGKESLELAANDPQGLHMTINGDLNGVPFSCGSSCSVPLPEGVGTVNYLVTSTSGRTASGLSTWQRDSILPVLNVVLPSLNGRNGWYASDVDIAANASDTISGLHSVTGSMDEGLNWTPFPFHVSDGISHIAARARDVAGNEVAKSEMVRVDTIPPIAHFTSHSNGEVVHGSVLLTGKLMDETSGVSQGELSPDSGIGWQAGSMDAGDTLSFTWNTNDVPNGQYSLQMRGIDVAGNVGDTASIMLVVDNKPPHVSLTDRWWIWESGQLKISPNYFPIASVKVTIRDPQDRWPAAIMEFDLEKVASSIYWNRRFADETLAPSGEFRVIAVACDIHNLCSSDTGIVAIPFVATSTVTLTPSPTATLTLTPQATFTETQKLATSTVVLVTSSPRVSSDSAQPRCALSFWQLLGLLGLFLAISSASVIDPRPAAIDRLRESIKLLSVHNAVDSSKADE